MHHCRTGKWETLRRASVIAERMRILSTVFYACKQNVLNRCGTSQVAQFYSITSWLQWHKLRQPNLGSHEGLHCDWDALTSCQAQSLLCKKLLMLAHENLHVTAGKLTRPKMVRELLEVTVIGQAYMQTRLLQN